MATIEQAKERYLVKAEKNGTNDNITTDNYRFCLLFNESQNKFLTLQLQNRGVDDVRYIQNFLVLDEKISTSSKSGDKYDFKLPDNYFDLADVRANAQKENCRDSIDLFELRTENITEVLKDEFQKPSFEWRESVFTVNSNNLSIYTDKTFKINDILLNYYRYPNQIQLSDEDNPESGFNEQINIEWDDKSLDDIITLMVFNLDINENNPRYQIQPARIQK